MARDDAPPLGPVPRKRRQLEGALDVHVAMWLASDDLTPSERRRVQEEKDRRRDERRAGPPVVLGFTAAREGMTPAQYRRVEELVAEHAPAGARHGDCVGGDAQFHEICRAAGVPVVLHPPIDPTRRARCRGAAEELPPKDFTDRNRDIVRESTRMIAAPKEQSEPQPARGQGTWSTVRYARHRGKPIEIVLPDGRLQEEE